MTVNQSDGILLIDKPMDITSNQLVQKVKKNLNVKKIGHCGTLDPFATGLMILCYNRGTKLVPYLTGLDKEYTAQIQFGEERDTDDRSGEVINTYSEKIILDKEKIETILNTFKGEISQIPPQYSAIKKNGVRAYKLVRQGRSVDLKPRVVNIYSLELIDLQDSSISVRVHCSKGTYIRSLAKDIGRACGFYAHLSELRRTKISNFSLVDNRLIKDLESKIDESNIINIRESLTAYPELSVNSNLSKKIYFGQSIYSDIINEINKFDPFDVLKLIDDKGRLIALVDRDIKYLNVFHYENI